MTGDTLEDRRATSLRPERDIARASPAPLLAVKGLSKQFEMHQLDRRLPAFADVGFDLQPGQFMLVSGGNGAGKSTLLRTLYRTYRAQAGRIIYRSHHGPIDLARAADVDVAHLRQTEIGFVTQFLQARPRVSAEAYVAEAVFEQAESHAEALNTARDMLAALGLKPALWPAYPAAFSGGEQQKVNLARALIRPCRLLLLDEPTASLDADARLALIERIGMLKHAGTAMIGVFHTPQEVDHLVDWNLRLSAPMKVPSSRIRRTEDKVTHVDR